MSYCIFFCIITVNYDTKNWQPLFSSHNCYVWLYNHVEVFSHWKTRPCETTFELETNNFHSNFPHVENWEGHWSATSEMVCLWEKDWKLRAEIHLQSKNYILHHHWLDIKVDGTGVLLEWHFDTTTTIKSYLLIVITEPVYIIFIWIYVSHLFTVCPIITYCGQFNSSSLVDPNGPIMLLIDVDRLFVRIITIIT